MNNASGIGTFESKEMLLDSTIFENIPYTLKLQNKLILHLACIVILLLSIIAYLKNKMLIVKFFNSTFANSNSINYASNASIANTSTNAAISNYTKNIYFSFKDIYLFVSSNFNIMLILYSIAIMLLIVANQSLAIMQYDDWVYSVDYNSFYHLTTTSFGWQRGRHIGDILMSISMRPFGEFLIAFGVDALNAFRIVSSFFSVVFYFLTFFACSLLLWFLNDKKDFKIIFITISLFILYMTIDYIEFVPKAAYIFTAGISVSVFLPLLYYFLFEKEIRFSKNVYFHFGILFLFVYFCAFGLEMTSLGIFGLCSFMLLYYLFIEKILLLKNRHKINLSIFYYFALFIFMIPSAFIMTILSGRGQRQQEVLVDSSIFENIFNNITLLVHNNRLFLPIVLFGILLLIYLSFRLFSGVSKKYFIMFAMIIVGIIGIIGFCAINVPYTTWMLLGFIFFALFVLLLECKDSNNKFIAFISSLFMIIFVVNLGLSLINKYEEVFNKYYPYRESSRNLINLFVEANKNKQKEIILDSKTLKENKLELIYFTYHLNKAISSWILRYGYSDEIIQIKLDESLEDSK